MSMIEQERLRSLQNLVALDSPPEPLFDTLAKMASDICGAPIALLSLVDEQRQWFKANVGLPGVSQTPRDVAFCAHAIQGSGVFVVPDASLDPRFADNPLVKDQPSIRFYAGAPVELPDGARVGTLCVIDHQPRSLSPSQSAMLQGLALLASQALTMRQDLITRTVGAQKHYETQLAVSEARLRALVEGQSELVSLAEADGTLVYVGPAYASHFGMDSPAMVGTNLYDHIVESDRPAVRQMLDAVMATGVANGSENRMLSANGTPRWVSWENSVQEDSSGRLLLRSVGRDVTERHAIEVELRASQSLLARTGRLAGVGGWELEIATGKLSWSEQTRRIHEVDEHFEPRVDTAIGFYAPEARPVIEQAVKRCMERGTPYELDLPMVTAKGRRIWARALGEVELENGVATRLVGAFADITERKLLELKLADSERFIRKVTDSLPIGIAYLDMDLRFRFVNQEHSRRFGMPRGKIIGRTREELTGRAYMPTSLARVKDALAGAVQRFATHEIAHGVERLMEIELIPDVDGDGTVKGLFGLSSDITERAAAEKRLRDLTAILENTPDFVAQTNREGNVTYMNPAARRFCGLTADEPIEGRSNNDFHTNETNELFASEIIPAVKKRGVWTGEARVRGAGGREAPVSHMVIGHRNAEGKIERYSAVMRDITRAVESRRRLELQTDTLHAVIEAIPAMVAVGGADGMVTMVNSAYERWTGTDRAASVGRPVDERLAPAQRLTQPDWKANALHGETASYYRSVDLPGGVRHVAGTYSPLRAGRSPNSGFILVAQDETEHKREGARLLQLAQRDPLTGLFNRAGFEASADAFVEQEDGDLRAALLCIDLDHFKPVNDTHGHPAGDSVLREFAKRVLSSVRPTDIVARLGGDEFAVLLIGVEDEANARMIASKIVAAAAAPFVVDRTQVTIGASVGIAIGVASDDWQAFFARADAMLYKAKGAGRGTCVTK